MELVYADYANSMKAMGNQARLEYTRTGKIAYDKNAKRIYDTEITELLGKLRNAELNTVRERAAQRMANVAVKEKQDKLAESGEKMAAKDAKKAGQQALTRSRNAVGSISRRDRNIQITDREWEAIQAGAISESILKRILDNSDPASLRQRAMPKATNTLSDAKIGRIKAMSSSYTIKQIADKLGLSTSTVSKYLKGGIDHEA